MTPSPPQQSAADRVERRRPALLVAGHGTRDGAGVEEYLALAERVRARNPGLAVGCGFLELSPPPLSSAIADLVAAGHDDIVVVPLVLFDAGHAKTDVPASVNLARAAHPGVRFRYGRGLGVDPGLLAACEERLDGVVDPAARADVGVLVVGRGSSDPDANAELTKVARLLWEGRGFGLVEPAFVGITDPRVPEGLERLRRLGADRIVVLPYFLFTGVLERRIRQQAQAFTDATGLRVETAGYLGPDDRVADLVTARYEETLSGPVTRGCDLCVHRTPLPGFEQKVGAPLTPHHHPDDPATHGHGASHAHSHDRAQAHARG